MGLLESAPHAMRSWEIASALDVRSDYVGDALYDMRAKGQVERFGEPRGYVYSLPIKLDRPERLHCPPVIAW